MECRLTGINLYPVKALGSLAVNRIQVTGRGLDGDRRWMVVDDQGKFLSQRTIPAMARLGVTASADGWILNDPAGKALLLPREVTGPSLQVSVWRDTVTVVAGPPEADAWLSAFLGRPCRLVFMDDACRRPVDLPAAPGAHQVSFADGYPLLLISEASLDLLNSKLDRPVGMDRFRTNLTVAGCPAHAEDSWEILRIGETRLRAVKPCSRCQVPTIDQETGTPSAENEPLRTLATYRSAAGGVMFGMNLVVEKEGWIEVGMPVQLSAGA